MVRLLYLCLRRRWHCVCSVTKSGKGFVIESHRRGASKSWLWGARMDFTRTVVVVSYFLKCPHLGIRKDCHSVSVQSPAFFAPRAVPGRLAFLMTAKYSLITHWPLGLPFPLQLLCKRRVAGLKSLIKKGIAG